jgi:hypothetical protein
MPEQIKDDAYLYLGMVIWFVMIFFALAVIASLT